MLRLTALYSGSKGNSYLIECGDSAILVDAGRSARAITTALAAAGVSPDKLSAVLLTHEHTDHVSALRVLSSKGDFPIYAAAPVLDAVCVTDEIYARAYTMRPGEAFALGDVTVNSCAVPHDSAACLAYRFTDNDGACIAIATDMGRVTNETAALCAGCSGVVLESNHDPDMLRLGSYPAQLKARIMSGRGHLSNWQCADFAAWLAESGSTAFALAHLSRENNTPTLATDAARQALDAAGHADAALCAIGECGGIRMVADGSGARIVPCGE